MRRILEFIRPYRREALAALLLVVLMTGVELAIPGLTQCIIDLGVAGQNMAVVRDTTLWMLVAGVASALLTIGNTVLAVRVSNDGQIIERGTHEQLLAKRGVYYNAYISQFKGLVVSAEARTLQAGTMQGTP